jgi:SAM-dependent methyltransferase
MMTKDDVPIAVADVEATLRQVLEDSTITSRDHRRFEAQRAAQVARQTLHLAESHLVYGELDVRTVATLLDAAEVRAGDRFVDIGSGDGLPTLAASLLYPEALAVCRGLEVVPELVARAKNHAVRLRAMGHMAAPVEMIQGDVYRATDTPAGEEAKRVVALLRDSTLALCFATTWSDGAPRRELPRLSAALRATMPLGARAIVVDGRLVEADGWAWEGDLRIVTPDTAPYSTARLYTAIATTSQ